MALATDLLPLAKQHMRVTFSDDDALIERYLNWAIDFTQNELGLQIHPLEYPWEPVTVTPAADRYVLPIQPVRSFVLTSGGIDVSAQYAIEQRGKISAPAWLIRKDGQPFPEDAAVVLSAGFATIGQMPPQMESAIFRIAGMLYEHRESVTTISLDPVPYWFRDLLHGLWVPRA